MNTSFGRCSLYLCPEQHDYNVKNLLPFIHRLQTIGFISKKIDVAATDATTTENSYLTGKNFLEHIAYMGCSPAIQFEPGEANKNYCHIDIHQHTSAQLIVSNKQSRAPHCPHCKKPVKNWQDQSLNTAINCDQCHVSSNIEKFNWRKMGGYAQLFIEITDIFPKEAMPQELLLDKLLQITSTRWIYFYSCQ